MIEQTIVERIRKNVADLHFCREILAVETLTPEQRAIFEKKYEAAKIEERKLAPATVD